MTRRWAINGRFLAQPLTGVQRYAEEIVSAIDVLRVERPSLADEVDIELLVPPETRRTLPLRTIRTRMVGRGSGHLWEQAVLPAELRGGLLGLCNTGPVAIRRQIVCIHDVNPRAYPTSYSLQFRLFYRALLPLVGRRSCQVTTVSRYSAGELARYGICKPDRITVLPNGHEHALRWRPMHSPATAAVAGPDTIVVIGSTIPHKNVRLVLSLADRLAAANLRIAVVGAADPRVFSAAVPLAEADNVSWLGRLSDAELAALLGDSLCLAFPSFVEGFGLPPLEAMALGCAVVVSDGTSLPEVCGNAALYASPDDACSWLEHFVRLRNEPGLRAALVARGMARSRLFSWRESARGYLDLMASADGVEPAAPGPRAMAELTLPADRGP